MPRPGQVVPLGLAGDDGDARQHGLAVDDVVVLVTFLRLPAEDAPPADTYSLGESEDVSLSR